MKLRNKQTGETITLKNDRELALLKFVESSLPNGFRLWEEVKEPLITNEKIRKAVRAWAEANEVIKAFVVMNKNMNWTIYGDDIDRNRFEIEFFDRVVSENDETKNYTIEELCGEEEE